VEDFSSVFLTIETGAEREGAADVARDDAGSLRRRGREDPIEKSG
jgi:hypothetical protein